jgi:SecD/SecF fusion protein
LTKATAADQIAFDLSSPLYADGSAIRLETWNIRLGTTPERAAAILDSLSTSLAQAPIFPSSDNVGAAVAASAKTWALLAMIVSLAMVMAYVWFRFQNVAFGIASIAALLHDVLFTIGCLALSFWLAKPLGFALVEPFKIDLTIVAALLTIIGYSINDTIVIFDRIREVRGKSPTVSADLINKCLNQTLSRTILTSLTVFIVVLILYIFGGQGIHGFAFALVVGTISGTYSTIYVASPILLWMYRKQNASAQVGGAVQSAAK